ncbi:hypothetical protein, partial [Desulfovibrio sp.]|uniref:hypothetical protein n=1 Tax=Desulfovibrio sp. TaxID=885 RepID=UPI0025C49F99
LQSPLLLLAQGALSFIPPSHTSFLAAFLPANIPPLYRNATLGAAFFFFFFFLLLLLASQPPSARNPLNLIACSSARACQPHLRKPVFYALNASAPKF